MNSGVTSRFLPSLRHESYIAFSVQKYQFPSPANVAQIEAPRSNPIGLILDLASYLIVRHSVLYRTTLGASDAAHVLQFISLPLLLIVHY
jgi:hypothetical protein